jgi:ABC-type Na+ transport system ATPase subunit NatA
MALLPMVLIFSIVVRSPNYSRGLVTLVNIFMYIYGFSYAWDNSNESIIALLMPHYHYSNFIITFYRQNPELKFFFPQTTLKKTFFSKNPKTSMVILFVIYMILYIILEKVIEELDGRIVKYCGKLFRKITKCFKKKKNITNKNVNDKIEIDDEVLKRRNTSSLHWNNPNKMDFPEDSEKTFRLESSNYLILRNIWKFFGNFPALSNVSIALKQGEITCLLGHNGAGKSTLINILTGFLHPSEGEILWNNEVKFGGKNQSINELRNVGIGICTSKDILYESMTVYEHLKLAGLIKGISDRKSKINKMIQTLNLEKYRNVKVGKLSGGCKRKLSIGIALIGDPKIVFLDEPTSALDPVSRQEILKMLAKLKVNNNQN